MTNYEREDCAYYDRGKCKILQEMVCARKRCTFFSVKDTRRMQTVSAKALMEGGAGKQENH